MGCPMSDILDGHAKHQTPVRLTMQYNTGNHPGKYKNKPDPGFIFS
jgi:hypothetical protein